MVVDTAGAVIDGLDVKGSITVNAPNVVIKRSRFTGDGSPWAIRTQGNGSVQIEDVTIRGDYSDAGIGYHNWTADRVEIVGMTNDGAKVGNNVTVRNSWFHDFVPAGGAHSDGLQVVEDVGNIVIENSRIDPGSRTGSNAAVFLSPDIGPERPGAGPVTIRGNTLGGGGYTLYYVGGSAGALLQDVRVMDNRFARNFAFGPIRAESVPKQESNNTFIDGQPITWPS